MLLTWVSPGHFINVVGHKALKTWQSHLIPLPSLHGGEGASLSGCVSPDDMIESMVGIKPADSGTLIG